MGVKKKRNVQFGVNYAVQFGPYWLTSLDHNALTKFSVIPSKRRTRVQPAEDFPLRGVLYCWCGQSMTAGWTKGRKEYYLYYRCTKHTSVNIPGNLIHDKFVEVLKALNFKDHQVKFLLEQVKVKLVEPMKLKKEKHDKTVDELKKINEKIYQLEERLMNNEIESSTYQTWFKKFKEDKAILESSLNGNHKSRNDIDEDIKERLMPYLSKLHDIYDKGNIVQKQTLIRGVFKDNLTWGEGAFRTAFINPAFHDNLLRIKEKGLLFEKQSLVNLGLSPVSTRRHIANTPILR